MSDSRSASLGCRREAFRLPDGVHYLNCAYLSPLPRAVEEAGIAGMRRKRVPVDFTPADFFEDSDRLRRRFARLVGTPEPERVAILPSVSYGIAVAARNLEVEPGRNLLVLEDQFPSNVYAWRVLARERGAELRTVPRPREAGDVGRAWTTRILESLDARTAVVALPHVHWTDGTRLDLVRIGEEARARGAALVVDGSQSVGALPFDVAAIRPDALVVAGYKWMMGPYSLCLGWYGPRFDGGRPLEETWIARTGSEDFQGLVAYSEDYRPGAVRYDVGERSNFILVPMMIAALDLLLDWRPERIQAHCRRLLADLVRDGRERGLVTAGDGRRGEHILGLRLPEGSDPRRLARALEARRVHVSLRGDAVRVAPAVYNRRADVEALREALEEALP